MSGFARRKDPARKIDAHSVALPPYGPEVPGGTPHLPPSIYCSWCGRETLEQRDVKRCRECDL